LHGQLAIEKHSRCYFKVKLITYILVWLNALTNGFQIVFRRIKIKEIESFFRAESAETGSRSFNVNF